MERRFGLDNIVELFLESTRPDIGKETALEYAKAQRTLIAESGTAEDFDTWNGAIVRAEDGSFNSLKKLITEVGSWCFSAIEFSDNPDRQEEYGYALINLANSL